MTARTGTGIDEGRKRDTLTVGADAFKFSLTEIVLVFHFEKFSIPFES